MSLSLFVSLSVRPSVACASSVFSSQKILLWGPISSIFFEFLCFLFLLDGLLLLESDLGLFMFLGSGKRTTHLTLWTLETSTFLIFLIRSIDGSTAKFLADIGLIVPSTKFIFFCNFDQCFCTQITLVLQFTRFTN